MPERSSTPPPTTAIVPPERAPDAAPAREPIALPSADAGPVLHPDRDPNAPENVEAIPKEATVTASGLGFLLLDPGLGSGAIPAAEDSVKIIYTGWTSNGVIFDRGTAAPTMFRMDKLSAAWQEGLTLMSEGQRARLWVPEHLSEPSAHGMTVFDVELVTVIGGPKVPADVAAPPRAAKRTKKGVRYVVLTKGSGKKKPKAHDKVTVHYSGWTADGKLFDSSRRREKPATFAVSGVIEGWTDALLRMREGDVWRVWIPKKLAYEDKPGRPQGMLVFEIELISILSMPKPSKTPRDVRRPPRRASATASGVRYRFLNRGKRSADKPTAADKVEVHYSGWTTDGKLFDSSITRGRSATFGLGHVIPGFRDGLLKMRVGDKARLWIPEELAYKGRPGAPKGMLVFDVELLSITREAKEQPAENPDGADTE